MVQFAGIREPGREALEVSAGVEDDLVRNLGLELGIEEVYSIYRIAVGHYHPRDLHAFPVVAVSVEPVVCRPPDQRPVQVAEESARTRMVDGYHLTWPVLPHEVIRTSSNHLDGNLDASYH